MSWCCCFVVEHEQQYLESKRQPEADLRRQKDLQIHRYHCHRCHHDDQTTLFVVFLLIATGMWQIVQIHRPRNRMIVML